jgi:hypothetical protein
MFFPQTDFSLKMEKVMLELQRGDGRKTCFPSSTFHPATARGWEENMFSLINISSSKWKNYPPPSFFVPFEQKCRTHTWNRDSQPNSDPK